MVEAHDQVMAAHYAAYRPPLHQIILARALPDAAAFLQGLDVGCGAGHSTHALAAYCGTIYGVDPSPHMLNGARPNAALSFLHGCAENIPLPDRCVDIVTFAGSLYYTDRSATARELKRVCRANAIVITYDFEILLSQVLQWHGLSPEDAEPAYDHSANFAEISEFPSRRAESELISLETSASELAHLLLSEPHIYTAYANRFKVSNPFEQLKNTLAAKGDEFSVGANIYFTKYRLLMRSTALVPV